MLQDDSDMMMSMGSSTFSVAGLLANRARK